MSELYEIYILLEKGSGGFLGIWEKEGNCIRDVSVDNHEIELEPSMSVCDGIIQSKRHICCNSKLVGVFSLTSELSSLKRGVYFPRIYKPIYKGMLDNEFYIITQFDYFRRNKEFEYLIKDYNSKKEGFDLPINRIHFIDSIEQLKSFFYILNDILRTIYPATENLHVYGHNVRNLILVTCTEFETQMQGILKANNIPSLSNTYTTRDYVRLMDTLYLKSYSIELKNYPNLQSFTPFKNWEKQNPTKSLTWYDSYNKLKHDRENQFSVGTIEVLLNSISACLIVLIAQYGERPEISQLIENNIRIVGRPPWVDTRIYYKPFKNDWQSENYIISQ